MTCLMMGRNDDSVSTRQLAKPQGVLVNRDNGVVAVDVILYHGRQDRLFFFHRSQGEIPFFGVPFVFGAPGG